MAVNYIGADGSAISALFKILSPFIWGLVISYLLGPLVRTLENKVFRPLASKLYKKNKRSDGHGFARGMSILFSEINNAGGHSGIDLPHHPAAVQQH